MMELTIFQESPELQPSHDKGIIWRGIVSKTAVEVVDLLQGGHVTEYHK